jgi:Amt family ammonium transporter
MNHHWAQVGYQFADATAGAAWSFAITYIILFVMNKIPGLSLRVDRDAELQGLDVAEIGEMAYYHVDKVVTIDPSTGEEKIIKEEVKEVHMSQAQGSVGSSEKPFSNDTLDNV